MIEICIRSSHRDPTITINRRIVHRDTPTDNSKYCILSILFEEFSSVTEFVHSTKCGEDSQNVLFVHTAQVGDAQECESTTSMCIVSPALERRLHLLFINFHAQYFFGIYDNNEYGIMHLEIQLPFK